MKRMFDPVPHGPSRAVAKAQSRNHFIVVQSPSGWHDAGSTRRPALAAALHPIECVRTRRVSEATTRSRVRIGIEILIKFHRTGGEGSGAFC